MERLFGDLSFVEVNLVKFRIKHVVFAFIFLSLVGLGSSFSSYSSVDVDADHGFFEDYDDEVIVMEFTANDFDATEIHVDADDISSEIEGEVTEDVVISIENKESYARYPLREHEEVPAYEIAEEEWEWGATATAPDQDERVDEYWDWANPSLPGDDAGACDDINNDGNIDMYIDEWTEYSITILSLYGQTNCWSESSDNIANVMEIQSSEEEVQEMEIDVNGESVVISNADIGEGRTATVDDFVKFNWRGGYETGYNFPTPVTEKVAYNNDRGFWFVERESVESGLQSYRDGMFDMLDHQYVNGDKEIGELEDDVNAHIEYEILDEYEQSEFLEDGRTVDEVFETDHTTVEDSVIEIQGDRMGSFPTVDVVLKAEELNYQVPEGEPEISYVNDDITIQEGETGIIEVGVENVGDGRGNFEVRIDECTDNFSPGGSGIGIQPDAGETEEAGLQVVTSSDEEQETYTGTCTIEVDNLRDPDTTLTYDANLEGQQLDECEAGEQFREYDVSTGTYEIWECNEEGTATEIVQECDEGEIAEPQNGEYECVDEDESDTRDGREGDDSRGDDETGECELFTMPNPVPLMDDIPVNDPLCELGVYDALYTIYSMLWALSLGLGLFIIFRVIDGERRIQGRFRIRNDRRVSRFQKGSLLVGAIGFVIGALLGYAIGITLHLAIQTILLVLTIYLLVKLAGMIGVGALIGLAR